MLAFARVAVGTGEALGCIRCGDVSAPTYRSTEDVLGDIAEVVGAWSVPPGPNVTLAGAEPFGHPELPRIVSGAIEAGVERLALETDAGALAIAENAVGALRTGVRHVHVRLRAASPAVGDALSGRPGRTATAAAGVATFLDAARREGLAVAVTAIVPVCAHNLQTLPQTAATLAEWGVHALRLVGAGELPSGAEALIAATCDTGMVNGLWVETDGKLPLPRGHALHVVSEGGRADG